MKKIFLSAVLFLSGVLLATNPHDFKTAYTQTTQTLTYPAFLIRVANNAKTPLDARKAACDELLTRNDLSPDNALDVVISLAILESPLQLETDLSTIIKCFDQSPALPVPAWTKVILEIAKQSLSEFSPESSIEDIIVIEQSIKTVMGKYNKEISQFCANSNIYSCRAALVQYHTLEACDPAYSCGAEERFYKEATL